MGPLSEQVTFINLRATPLIHREKMRSVIKETVVIVALGTEIGDRKGLVNGIHNSQVVRSIIAGKRVDPAHLGLTYSGCGPKWVGSV